MSVLVAIHLNYRSRRDAGEIDDRAIDDDLPAKMCVRQRDAMTQRPP